MSDQPARHRAGRALAGRAASAGRAAVRGAQRALRLIELAAKIVAVATGLVFGGAVFLGVVYRYVFASPFPYATELPRVLFPWFIMMGAVLAAARGEHLRLEVVTARLPRRLRLALLVVTSALVVFSFWVLVEVSVAMLPSMQRASTPLLDWPVSIGFASVPVGLGGIALCVALRLVTELFGGAEAGPEPIGHDASVAGW